MKELWTEKYRPNNTTDYVFQNEAQRKQINSWISDGALPHLLFSGVAGTGKTTLAKVLLHELDVQGMDIMEINASNENNVETIRTKITSFASTMPWGDLKYVLLDEADYLTPSAQAILRGVMEQYHASCRFILTCNYPNKIIPALHSRCQTLHIDKLDITEFTTRVATIGIAENVNMDLETLDTFVKATYPDLRKCINLIQQNVVDNKLQSPSDTDSGSSSDWMIDAVNLFKNKKFKEGRSLIFTRARGDEYEDIYKFMYQNLELWGDSDFQKDMSVLKIREGMANIPLVADPEINLCATLVELQYIAES
jgi:DNA polymerase III delta prime subunit